MSGRSYRVPSWCLSRTVKRFALSSTDSPKNGSHIDLMKFYKEYFFPRSIFLDLRKFEVEDGASWSITFARIRTGYSKTGFHSLPYFVKVALIALDAAFLLFEGNSVPMSPNLKCKTHSLLPFLITNFRPENFDQSFVCCVLIQCNILQGFNLRILGQFFEKFWVAFMALQFLNDLSNLRIAEFLVLRDKCDSWFSLVEKVCDAFQGILVASRTKHFLIVLLGPLEFCLQPLLIVYVDILSLFRVAKDLLGLFELSQEDWFLYETKFSEIEEICQCEFVAIFKDQLNIELDKFVQNSVLDWSGVVGVTQAKHLPRTQLFLSEALCKSQNTPRYETREKTGLLAG